MASRQESRPSGGDLGALGPRLGAEPRTRAPRQTARAELGLGGQTTSWGTHRKRGHLREDFGEANGPLQWDCDVGLQEARRGLL